MQIQNWLHEGRVQNSQDAAYGGPNIGTMVAVPPPLTPHHTTQQLSPSPYVSWHFPNCWPSSGAHGECLWASESVSGDFKGDIWFLVSFCFTQPVLIPNVFIVRFCGNPGLWSPYVGVKPLAPSGKTLQPLPFPILNCHTWSWDWAILHPCPSYHFEVVWSDLVVGILFS